MDVIKLAKCQWLRVEYTLHSYLKVAQKHKRKLILCQPEKFPKT